MFEKLPVEFECYKDRQDVRLPHDKEHRFLLKKLLFFYYKDLSEKGDEVLSSMLSQYGADSWLELRVQQKMLTQIETYRFWILKQLLNKKILRQYEMVEKFYNDHYKNFWPHGFSLAWEEVSHFASLPGKAELYANMPVRD